MVLEYRIADNPSHSHGFCIMCGCNKVVWNKIHNEIMTRNGLPHYFRHVRGTTDHRWITVQGTVLAELFVLLMMLFLFFYFIFPLPQANCWTTWRHCKAVFCHPYAFAYTIYNHSIKIPIEPPENTFSFYYGAWFTGPALIALIT